MSQPFKSGIYTGMTPSEIRERQKTMRSSTPPPAAPDVTVAWQEVSDACEATRPSPSVDFKPIIDLLSKLGIETPKVFSHGPDSVVLNWPDRGVYVTISQRCVGILKSRPEKIESRMELFREAALPMRSEAQIRAQAKLEEALWWEHLVTADQHGDIDVPNEKCMYCKRIAELRKLAGDQ